MSIAREIEHLLQRGRTVQLQVAGHGKVGFKLATESLADPLAEPWLEATVDGKTCRIHQYAAVAAIEDRRKIIL